MVRRCIISVVVSVIAALVIGLFLRYANQKVIESSVTWIYADVEKSPFNNVGIVPGTRPGGLYFRNRIDAAAALYDAGKVKWLIVSGDNRRQNYNEPAEMKNALVKKGVPASVIYCDYAGFTTLDTVIRARDIFGQTKITIISQEFQNQRAIFLARKNGIEATGLNAADVPAERRYWLGGLREYVARGRAIVDTSLFHRRPRFGGAKIIPGEINQEGCTGLSSSVAQ